MRFGVVLGPVVALAVLGGCSILEVGYDVEKMRGVEATGSAFTKALTEEYRQLTLFEADEMYDWRDASHFARKGARTAAGEAVAPDEIAARDLPADKVDELTQAHTDLVQLLDAGARDKAAGDAAAAQGSFDCWMEQQEENFQEDHIAACRDKFHAAMERLRAAMKPAVAAEPAPAPAPQPEPEPALAPKPFVVLFGFDMADVSAAAAKIIDEAVAMAKKVGAADFSVTGHADRAGSDEYNSALSLRRANAVRDALVTRAIDGARVSVAGRGEADPAVSTEDGVQEPANRRVEIIILQ
jgi:OOP family OmpA-OmpF porin